MKNTKAEIGYNNEGEFVEGDPIDVQVIESVDDFTLEVKQYGAKALGWYNRGKTIAEQAEARNELRRANGHAPEASPRKKFAEMSEGEQKAYRRSQMITAYSKQSGLSRADSEAKLAKLGLIVA
jgi:hypothetical protein